MTKRFQNISQSFYRILASNTFFGCIIVLFLLQSLWIALSNSYQLPFDEAYHFGIIDLYSHQWGPFISNQPDSAAVYGDVTRYPSYLYHYLLSFPYRFIELFTSSFVAKVIIFRIFNIILFAVGIYLFRKLLLKFRLSRRVVNFSLFIFILVPIVPLLATTTNYDNLLFVLVPIILMYAIDIIRSNKLNARKFILFLSLCFIATLVKYTFLPMFAILVVYVGIVVFRRKYNLLTDFKETFELESKVLKVILILTFIISTGLFIERIGLNAIRYHVPAPNCAIVQSIETCWNYPPWARNQRYIDRYKDVPVEGPVSFSKVWFPKMVNDGFIAFTFLRVDPVSIRGTEGSLVTKEALSLIKAIAKISIVVGLILFVVNFKWFWSDKNWRLIIITSAIYTAILWLLNYSEYKRLRHIVAIQPRYMLILAPIILAGLIRAYSLSIRNRNTKILLAVTLILVMVQGGGALIYILKSDASWYWNNRTIVDVNQATRNILSRFIIVR